jgi:putative oxidoreductase
VPSGYITLFGSGSSGSGLPDWFAWLVMLYETIGGLALIFGIYARWVALFLSVHLLFAAYLGHAANGWLFSNKGGGYEYPLFWAIACFTLTLLGDGAHAEIGRTLEDNRLGALHVTALHDTLTPG